MTSVSVNLGIKRVFLICIGDPVKVGSVSRFRCLAPFRPCALSRHTGSGRGGRDPRILDWPGRDESGGGSSHLLPAVGERDVGERCACLALLSRLSAPATARGIPCGTAPPRLTSDSEHRT